MKMNPSDTIQLTAVLVAVVAIIVSSVFSSKTIKASQDIAKQQYKLQFFAEYTKRYQDLILHMPKDIDDRPLNDKEAETFMRLYFDLCSEEYYLYKHDGIDEEVWGLWVDGMKTAMSRIKFREFWKELHSHYDDKDFVNFMYEDVINKSK